jgi:hypothetical protein
MTTKTSDKNAHADIAGNIANKPMIQVARTEPGAPLEPPVSAFTPILNPSRPSAEWSLDELGKYARKTLKKSAEASWEFGRALVLAKEKASRKFGKWTQQYVPELSTRTIQRYMAVGRLDYDDVQGKTVSDIYALLWGDNHTGKKGKTVNVSKQAGSSITALTKLLEGENSSVVLTANREALVALHAKLTALLVG